MSQSWRRTRDYRVWRIKVIRRDKVCQICGSLKGRQAHHMNSASYFPDDRFDVENGICLCGSCHSMFHNSYKRSYRQKCTKADFANFLELLDKLKDKTIQNDKISEWRTKLS